jgi:uncharacterized protein (DUF4213/DUF364 family)
MSAVKLSDGTVGLSSLLMPKDSDGHCKKSNRNFGDFTPLQITGKTVWELLEFPFKNNIVQSLKIATLNAISSKLLDTGNYKVLKNTDPVDLIDLNLKRTITMAGAFQSYIDRISKTGNRLFVLEFNKDALIGEDRRFFVPAANYKELLPVSDIVIITGLTLVNDTLDGLLETVKPEAQIIVTGPSSSFIPDILFQHHVKIVGAVRISNPEKMFQVVSEGGAGYHLFEYCAEKISVLNE